MQCAEGHRRRHPQSPHGLRRLGGDLSLGLLDRRQNVAAPFEIGGPRLRQADLARGAIEQSQPKMGLEVHDKLAGHRPRQAEPFGRHREMTAIGHRDKGLHRAQLVHIV